MEAYGLSAVVLAALGSKAFWVEENVAGRAGTLGAAEESRGAAGVVIAGVVGAGAAVEATVPPARSQGLGGEGIRNGDKKIGQWGASGPVRNRSRVRGALILCR